MAKNENICRACSHEIVYEETPPVACPNCNQTYWNKPGDERTLFQLQEIFLVSRDKDVLGKMFEIIKRYSSNLIKKRIRTSGRRGIQASIVDDLSHEAAYKFINYYISNVNFKIGDSFGGYINLFLGGVMNPVDQHDLHSEFSLDEQFSEDAKTTADTKLERPSSIQASWQEKLISAPHEIAESRISEMLSTIDQKVFSHQGWSASMLFVVGLHCKFKDRRAIKKLSHLQVKYGNLPVLENLERAELMVRTSLVEGY